MLVIPSETVSTELPDFYLLGETRAEVSIDDAIENRNAAVALAGQANYYINIFTQELDHRVFDNAEFERHVSQLARRHPNTQIRILVQDSSEAVRRGHRIIRLAQNMTSSIHIRNPSRNYSDEISAFMVVDGLGLLYRVNGDSRHYDANVNFMSPLRARKLDEYFDEVWEQSEIDLQVRRLYM